MSPSRANNDLGRSRQYLLSSFGPKTTAAALAIGLLLGSLLGNEKEAASETDRRGAGEQELLKGSEHREAVRMASPQRSSATNSSLHNLSSADLNDEDDAEKERARREHQSKELVELLLTRVRSVNAAFRDAHPEAVVNHVRPYQAGLIDGVLNAMPELTDSISQHVQTALCDGEAKDAQLMLMAHVVSDRPELATAAGFDCIFQRRGKEDIVLWTALEAWRKSGLEATPGLANVEAAASDLRTKALLQRGADSPPSDADVGILASRHAPEGVTPTHRTP